MRENTYAPGNGKGSAAEPSTKTLLEKHLFCHRIMGAKELTPHTRVVAAYLMYKTNCEHETCWPGRQSIADDTGISLRTVGEALRELKAQGWIEWREREGTSSVYRFVWSRADYDDAEQASYVARDIAKGKMPRQDPALANSATPGKDRQGGMATVASITKGNELREDISLSSASPTKESAEPGKSPSPSAETNPHPKHSTKWWDWQLWYVTGPRFKARFYPTVSKAAFGKRLGEIKRRAEHDLPRVDQLLRDTLKAEPGGDAWEYVSGIMRGATSPRNRPLDELDRGYRPRAPIDDVIM